MSKDRLDIEEGKEVVGRTIVGGRPLARRTTKIRVPIGVEKVLCKAAMDTAFRDLLFKDREGALRECGYELLSSEGAILRTVPDMALEAMVARIDMERHGKGRFMKRVAACVLAAATATSVLGCETEDDSMGVRPYPNDGAVQLEDVMSGEELAVRGSLADLGLVDSSAQEVTGSLADVSFPQDMEAPFQDTVGSWGILADVVLEEDILVAPTGILSDVPEED